MSVASLVAGLRESRGFRHKTDIAGVVSSLARRLPGGASEMAQAVALGDDCAALADGDGYLLFAIEGMVSDFVHAMPWFAGYSSVMVNISDIYAMGGRPLAVVDALWSSGVDAAHEVLAGMAAASVAYGVPIVGGHTNARSDQAQLAVSILGRANKLLSSFNAKPGDRLLMAVDLRGRFEEPYSFWNASVGAPAARLRGDLELLPQLAESGLCDAAKDISMAGTLGTALMLLECSGVGARIDLARIPRPTGVPFERWLSAFPSFGFLLSVREEHVEQVQAQFAERALACAAIGTVDASRKVFVEQDGDAALLWDFSDEAFIVATDAAEAIAAAEVAP
ncbi:sll0787 family AIR synthase-like protein [Paraburkholderia sp. DHOC27]|uniref:sll0787 family AIR synthase-like protein n=1 Tax=Paraburkholderia sp. DHOC27 TaxID=2303330 RepID=UPI000E3E0CEC|nr:sll0787 family AIR synthase-like protein [Paraburkholderia sp. DHOC27]RFU46523.1 sll0787 family AIR synthase-like protein [Paraburkholderia sp. DHOC27]